MDYEQIEKALLQYAGHNEKGFRDMLLMKAPFSLAFPTLKGPTGIGKTAMVEQFARNHGLLLQKWDAEGMALEDLCATLSVFTERFMKAKNEGALFLIERFDMLDEASVAFLKAYTRGEATADVRVAGKGIVPVTVKRTPNLNLVAEITD